ncbi:sulfotransferase domain-containing protein [Streptomyces luomodiensis]|uniref:Sulfotransferase domain-containing protein n=1 Tax=Streptomyces luomodiensis TaxID=3026192 RepID=A0ABY9VAD7_9ACTN|nr:sulfotransferase domain-containing protein [Streptomyces sp. SCA4-21]WNF01213.1 sulfotransferase domain-containing protein [Streptomyces sp. SCA4-21]
MSGKVYYLLHGIQDRYNALYQENMKCLGAEDIAVASIGGSGQSLLGNILQEVGLNYTDPYIEALHADGTSSPVPAYSDYAQRLSATADRHGGERPLQKGQWPRFFKTHLTPGFLEQRPLKGVWILVRDPRDSLFSWYKFRTNFAKDPLDIASGTFHAWLERPGPAGVSRLADWSIFYEQWADRRAAFQVSTLTTYEDLKREPVATLRSNFEDLGVTVPDDAISRAVEKSSFANMRAHESKSQAKHPDPVEGNTRIMRSGTPNEWLQWITPELERQFMKGEMPAVAERYGYDLAPQQRSAG